MTRHLTTRDEAESHRRASLFGLESLFADAVWSNATREPFCLNCQDQTTKSFEMMLPVETICASCGKRIDGGQ